MFQPLETLMDYPNHTEELKIRTAEACDCAEKLEDIFFRDLLNSSRILRDWLKNCDPVVKCGVKQLKSGDICSKLSMERSMMTDIQVFSTLKQYVVCIQHHDEKFRGNKHGKGLSDFVDKLSGIITLLEELVSEQPNVETVSDGFSCLSTRSSRAKILNYDYKIVCDSIRILTDMKEKLKEVETIFVIHDRS